MQQAGLNNKEKFKRYQQDLKSALKLLRTVDLVGEEAQPPTLRRRNVKRAKSLRSTRRKPKAVVKDEVTGFRDTSAYSIFTMYVVPRNKDAGEGLQTLLYSKAKLMVKKLSKTLLQKEAKKVNFETDEIVRRAVLIRDIQRQDYYTLRSNLNVGKIVYESLDKFEDDARKIYYKIDGDMEVNDLKKLSSSPTILQLQVSPEDITPITENIFLGQTCENYKYGKIVGRVPRWLYWTTASFVGYAVYQVLPLIVDNSALGKKCDELNSRSSSIFENQRFMTGPCRYRLVFQRYRRTKDKKEAQALLLDPKFILEIGVLLGLKGYMSPFLTKSLQSVTTIFGFLQWTQYISFTLFFETILGRDRMIRISSSVINAIPSMVGYIEDKISKGVVSLVDVMKKLDRKAKETWENILKIATTLIPIIPLGKKLVEVVAEMILKTWNLKLPFDTMYSWSISQLGFNFEKIFFLMQWFWWLEAGLVTLKLLCPLLLWQTGQLENCAYQPVKKEKSELYKDLKF